MIHSGQLAVAKGLQGYDSFSPCGMIKTVIVIQRRVLAVVLYCLFLCEQLLNRIDCVKYSLACDDEANLHYGMSPSRIFRFRIGLKAFLTGG